MSPSAGLRGSSAEPASARGPRVSPRRDDEDGAALLELGGKIQLLRMTASAWWTRRSIMAAGEVVVAVFQSAVVGTRGSLSL